MAESNGLLDLMKSPAAMGLLAAGFGGLAGANRNTPYNNLGRAGLAGLAGYSAADALQQKQYKIDQEKAMQAAIPTLWGEDGTFDYKRGAEIINDPVKLKAYAELPNAGRPKVARTMDVPGINGQKFTIQLDDYGNKVGDVIQSFTALQQVNDGQNIRYVQPSTDVNVPLQLTKAQQLADLRAQQNQALSAANKPFQVVNGQTVPNANYQQYQIDKAAKGAPVINMGQKGFDNTLKLRGDFRSEPIYKAYQETTGAWNQIQSSLKQASPAGDLAGATKIMKLLDPGSVVRESELGMAMQASGAMDRLQNYASNVMNGTKLTPKQREDFLALGETLYRESGKQYNTKRDEYLGIANRNELNADDVVGPAFSMPEAPPRNGAVHQPYDDPAKEARYQAAKAAAAKAAGGSQ